MGIYHRDHVTIRTDVNIDLTIIDLAIDVNLLCRKIFYIKLTPLNIDIFSSKKKNCYAKNDYKNKIWIGILPEKTTSDKIAYALCHEMGHLVLGNRVKMGQLPQVTWDEAWAHFFAVQIVFNKLRPELYHHYRDMNNIILEQNNNFSYKKRFTWDTVWSIQSTFCFLCKLQNKLGCVELLDKIAELSCKDYDSSSFYYHLRQALTVSSQKLAE